MKKLIILLSVFMLLSFTSEKQTEIQESVAQSTLENDKEFLLNYIQETTNNLALNIRGLSEAQLQFKPAPDSWSISQCVEHIIATELMLLDMSQTTLAGPENPERKQEVTTKDKDMISGMEDRSKKFKAPEILIKEGKYTDAQTAMQEFMETRQKLVDLVNNVSLDDMRNRISDSPAGAIDTYQSLLFIAGHCARHTLQIEEIKAAPNFPLQ